ncbi:MAG: hypothetical protein ACREFP_08320, partial [Acetobacteraceae bacterium]
EHLPGNMVGGHGHAQWLAARRTGLRIIVDDGIGRLDPAQRLTGWPFCPPVFLPDGSSKLLTRGGFFSPSPDGGWPLLLLFSPSRRSNSAMRACSADISSCCSAFCLRNAAITASADAGPGDAAVAGSCESEPAGREMGSLTHVPSRVSPVDQS